MILLVASDPHTAQKQDLTPVAVPAPHSEIAFRIRQTTLQFFSWRKSSTHLSRLRISAPIQAKLETMPVDHT
jgi:hypothetical protein